VVSACARMLASCSYWALRSAASWARDSPETRSLFPSFATSYLHRRGGQAVAVPTTATATATRSFASGDRHGSPFAPPRRLTSSPPRIYRRPARARARTERGATGAESGKHGEGERDGAATTMEHRTTIVELSEGRTQTVCSCGWRSAVFGADKSVGTMDALQQAAEVRDLHEWDQAMGGSALPGRRQRAPCG